MSCLSGEPDAACELQTNAKRENGKADGAAEADGNFGSGAVASTPEEFARMLRQETALSAKLVKEIGRQ
jgi:hypothetical protein